MEMYLVIHMSLRQSEGNGNYLYQYNIASVMQYTRHIVVILETNNSLDGLMLMLHI